MAWLGSGVATAGETSSPSPLALANFPYTLDGPQFYSVAGQSAQVYRIPFGVWLRRPESGRFGLKLTLPVSLGVHEIEAEAAIGSRRRTFETVSLVPGVEVHVGVTGSWTLKPYVETGLGRDLAGGRTAWIYAGGLRSLTTVRVSERAQLALGARLDYRGARVSPELSTGHGRGELGLELRWPLDAHVRRSRVDLGAFAIHRRYIGLDFTRSDGGEAPVDATSEVGFSIGAEPRLAVGWIGVPRLGVSYRWGPGIDAWLLNFGFPF